GGRGGRGGGPARGRGGGGGGGGPPPGGGRGGGWGGSPPPGQQRGSADPGYVVAAGTGTVYSYVVHHHPPVPGKRLPMVIALVELTEGVRIMAELTGIDPDQVEIGMPVRTAFLRIDDDLVLPGWRPDERGAPGV